MMRMVFCQWRNAGIFLIATNFSAASLASSPAFNLNVVVNDSAGHAVQDAVVYVESATPLKGATNVKPPNAEIEQKNKKFIPLVSVIQTGTAVFFPNNDTVRHHAYSFSPAKPFELKLYAGKPEAPIVFDKPGLVVVGCNIHDQMLAYIQVVDTPYFAKSDAGGKLKIPTLPEGKYILRAWHYKQMPGVPNVEQNLVVQGGDVTVVLKLNLKTN